MATINRMILFVLLGHFCSGQRECKMTTLGMEYFGNVDHTLSGKDCQSWVSQFPHKHKFNNTLKNSRNYCRNPDREPQGPWCYTTDEEKRWEYCRIPLCPITNDDCYEKGSGFMYTGKIAVTETGYACRRWDSEEAYAVFGELENYCRSPDGAEFPWCLSTAPGKRWERCNIPVCGQSTTNKPKISTTAPSSTTSLTSQGNPKIKPAIQGRLLTENICTQNSNNNNRSLTADLVIAVFTLIGVFAAVFFSLYSVIVLKQLKLQIINQNSNREKDVYTVDNSYMTGFSDMQPIVESRT